MWQPTYIKFSIGRTTNFMPVLKVTGETLKLQNAETFLMIKTVELIQRFEDLEGKVTYPMGTITVENIEKDKIYVVFYIIFRDEEALAEAILDLSEEKLE